MASFSWPPEGAGGGVPIYANVAAFPATATTGSLIVDASTGNLYEFNGVSWVQIAGPDAALSLGAFGSTPNADGASLTSGVLTLQPADGTHPGGISITTQTIAGQKTFSTGLTGTLTGSASLNVLTSALGNFTDSTSAADGITVTGGTGATVGSVSIAQAQASGSQNGYLGSTDWTTFNGKQAAGSYITALTGQVTASGSGSVAATIAAGTVTLANMVNLAADSIIGNNTASPATPIALTVSQVNTLLGALSNPMTTLGDIIYGGASGTPTRLAGNTTTTPEFYTSTGSGSAATAPTLTSSTGSGSVVLATSATLVTPALGTPSALVLTNATGTPSAAIGLANATGLPLTTGVSGVLPIANGGTGLTFIPSACYTMAAGGTNLPTSSYTTLSSTYATWSLLWDTASAFSASAGTYTVGYAGKYIVNWALEYNTMSTGQARIIIVQSGGTSRTVVLAQNSSVSGVSSNVTAGSASFYCAVSDVLTLQGFQTSGSTMALAPDGAGYSHFDITWVGN